MADRLTLEEAVALSAGLKCPDPDCADQGFTVEPDGHGDWYQCQCEFCWTVEDSLFNRRRRDSDQNDA